MLTVACILMRHKYLSAFSELCVRSIKFSAFTDWSCCLVVDPPALRLWTFYVVLRRRRKRKIAGSHKPIYHVSCLFIFHDETSKRFRRFSFLRFGIYLPHMIPFRLSNFVVVGISRFSLLSLT
jgi:hypothetical protein